VEHGDLGDLGSSCVDDVIKSAYDVDYALDQNQLQLVGGSHQCVGAGTTPDFLQHKDAMTSLSYSSTDYLTDVMRGVQWGGGGLEGGGMRECESARGAQGVVNLPAYLTKPHVHYHVYERPGAQSTENI